MKCIVVDDERPALELLVGELQKCNCVEIIGQYSGAVQLLEDLPKLNMDAIFLDIHMAIISGLELVPYVRESCPHAKIVFVTAHSEYAVHAFEEEVFDYVVKPIYKERLQKTIERLHRDIPKARPAIRCFGKLHVTDGRATVHWQTTKAEEMFAYLLVNGSVRVDHLQEKVFADFSPTKAKQYIYTCVYMIKTSLQKVGLNDQISIIRIDGMYRLNLSDVDNEWENWADISNRSIDQVLSFAYLRLKQPIFQGLDSEWVQRERFKIEQKLLQICTNCLLEIPFCELKDGRLILLELLEYLDSDASFWSYMLQKLYDEHYVILANELRDKLFQNLIDQLGQALADRWLMANQFEQEHTDCRRKER